MNQKKHSIELLRTWIVSLIDGINEFVDEETKMKILEKGGKACSIHHGHLEKITEMIMIMKNKPGSIANEIT